MQQHTVDAVRERHTVARVGAQAVQHARRPVEAFIRAVLDPALHIHMPRVDGLEAFGQRCTVQMGGHRVHELAATFARAPVDRSGNGVPCRWADTVSMSSPPPSPVRPWTGTTGTPPRARDSSVASLPVPCVAARSFIVRATTVGRPSSSTIDRKYRAREMFVASSTATMRSGVASPLSPITASAATRSSGESGSSE